MQAINVEHDHHGQTLPAFYAIGVDELMQVVISIRLQKEGLPMLGWPHNWRALSAAEAYRFMLEKRAGGFRLQGDTLGLDVIEPRSDASEWGQWAYALATEAA